MARYDYVINSSFDPMSFQDRLAPFLIAKQEYDKQEQDYIDRQDKIDAYSFLNDYDDNSPAKQLYQGYVNAYNKSFDDFQQNGLTQANKRSWLNVRRSYQKNIGRLEKADADLQEELKRRQTLDAADSSRIYAKDTINLSIDDFLDRKKPNTYSISGNDLYKRGVEIGASGSSRIYSSPRVKQLTNMFMDAVQTQGYSPELVAQFRDNLATIPEFQKAVMSTLKEKGVTDNLTGINYQRAMKSVVNGIVNGITYKRSDNVQQNPDYITAYQQAQIDRSDREFNLNLALRGLKQGNDGNIVVDENGLPFQLQKLKNESKTANGDSGDVHPTQLNKSVKITWNHNNPKYSHKGEKNYGQYYNENGSEITGSVTSEELNSDEKAKGTVLTYNELPDFAKTQVDKIIKDGDPNYYDYYYSPYRTARPWSPGHPWINDDEATVTVVPRNLTTDKTSSAGVDFSELFGGAGTK